MTEETERGLRAFLEGLGFLVPQDGDTTLLLRFERREAAPGQNGRAPVSRHRPAEWSALGKEKRETERRGAAYSRAVRAWLPVQPPGLKAVDDRQAILAEQSAILSGATELVRLGAYVAARESCAAA